MQFVKCNGIDFPLDEAISYGLVKDEAVQKSFDLMQENDRLYYSMQEKKEGFEGITSDAIDAIKEALELFDDDIIGGLGTRYSLFELVEDKDATQRLDKIYKLLKSNLESLEKDYQIYT